jgi:hypothetical protein
MLHCRIKRHARAIEIVAFDLPLNTENYRLIGSRLCMYTCGSRKRESYEKQSQTFGGSVPQTQHSQDTLEVKMKHKDLSWS